jgi:hypothetical protein
MSLKAFHVFFIAVSTVFLLGMGAWYAGRYRADGGNDNLAFAVVGFGVGALLAIYGVWFLRKMQRAKVS